MVISTVLRKLEGKLAKNVTDIGLIFAVFMLREKLSINKRKPMEALQNRNLTWQQLFSEDEWLHFMARICKPIVEGGQELACIGDMHIAAKLQKLISSKTSLSLYARVSDIDAAFNDIVILEKDPKKVEAIVKALLENSLTMSASVHFKMDVKGCANRSLAKHDIFKNIDFYSSRYNSQEFDNLYEDSLKVVEKKCQVRDAQFLLQALENVRYVDGGIFEFGSYRGHSGWLLSEYCVRKGISKPLRLFDMFSHFPEESLGLDKMWNDTHFVDFEHIKTMFLPYQNVSLVQGDFTETYKKYRNEAIALALVDCDSYRAVDYLLHFMLPSVTEGGIILFEDYGHEPCAGVRIAVDDFVQKNSRNYKSFFCAYSGMFMLIKNTVDGC